MDDQCEDCGRFNGQHTVTCPVGQEPELPADIDEQIDQLMAEVDAAIKDAEADQGQEAVDNGGWWDITQSIVSISKAHPFAKREVCRMTGVTPPRF